MSSSSGPTSAFGNLAIAGDDGKDMPVTTRSAARRQTQTMSRPPTNPSASTSTRRPQRRVSAARDDSSSSDDDDDRTQNHAFIRAAVVRIMAAFDPARQLGPHEFETLTTNNEATRSTRKLAIAIAGLVKSRSDLNGLIAAAEFPAGFWARQLANNLELRWQNIQYQLNQNQRDASEGVGVVATITSIRDVYTEIDNMRQEYFAKLSAAECGRLTSILVSALQWMVINNEDIYANQARPAYAGEGIQSERRLLSSFLSAKAQPLRFLDTLRRFNGYLRHESTRLASIYRTLHAHISYVACRMEDGDDKDRLRRVLSLMHQIAHGNQAASS